jgi:hypothetical protein
MIVLHAAAGVVCFAAGAGAVGAALANRLSTVVPENVLVVLILAVYAVVGLLPLRLVRRTSRDREGGHRPPGSGCGGRAGRWVPWLALPQAPWPSTADHCSRHI